jgi:hypothetical protein
VYRTGPTTTSWTGRIPPIRPHRACTQDGCNPDYRDLKQIYTCEICLAKIARHVDSLPPGQDAHDYM